MAEELGTPMTGDPEAGTLQLDDIVSVGTERPPEAPEPQTPTAPAQPNGQPQSTPPTPPPSTPPSQEGTPPDGQTGPIGHADPPGEPGAEGPPGEPQTTPATEPPPADPWAPVLSTLNNQLGAQYEDQSQLVNDLTAFQQYKKDPLANLPVEIKAHADFLNAGGSTQEFYRLKSMDFGTMNDKEVLFQSYLRDHPEHAKNMDFARMDFDRSYQQSYGMLNGPKKTVVDFTNEDDEVDHQAWNTYQQDYTYWEQKRKVESDISRNKLQSWQEQATTPQHPDTGLTQEEAQAFQQQHQQAVQQVKTTYKGEVFPISDKPEESLKLGLSDNIRQQWEQDLMNPMRVFSELGLHADGKLDLEKFKSAAFIHRMWPQLGPIVNKLILENNNRQTVTGQQVNPTPSTPPGGTQPPGGAHGDDEMAEAAEGFFQQNQERMRQSRGYSG